MATSTPNLGLILPIGNEHVSRQIINRNMMILDESATNFDFNPDVMRDAILAVQDVTHVKIVLNRSDEEVNGIPAKSLLALVNNGGKTNICQAIYDTNTSGLATTGTLEKEIEGVTIKFSRPSLYALHFNIILEGFTAPSLLDIETSIKNALMTYINRTLQIGEVLSMENVRQIVYNAAGSEAANFRIKDLSCSGLQGVSRDFMDPGWNNKFTMSSGSDVTITSVQSQSSQAIDALNNNLAMPDFDTFADMFNSVSRGFVTGVVKSEAVDSAFTSGAADAVMLKYNGSYALQWCMSPNDDGKIKQRTMSNGVWGNWRSIGDVDQLWQDITVTWTTSNLTITSSECKYNPLLKLVSVAFIGTVVTSSGANNVRSAGQVTNDYVPTQKYFGQLIWTPSGNSSEYHQGFIMKNNENKHIAYGGDASIPVGATVNANIIWKL